MGSPCRVEAVIGIGLFLGVSGMVAAAPPLGISSGLFDSSQPRTQGLAKLKIEETILYKATARTHKFCHHPNLVRQGQRVFCMWSNGRVGEDEVGQRILYSTAQVGRLDEWSAPRELARDPSDQGACVAAGWLVNGPTLIAYYTVTGGTNFDPRTALWAKVSTDGHKWSGPRRIIPGFYIAGPVRMGDGSLLLAGEYVGAARSARRMAIFRTQRPDGLGGWDAAKIAPSDLKVFGYTEPAPYVLSGGRVVCPFRNYSGSLYASESGDDGRTWSVPVKTTFPDSLARHASGRLPDGQYFLINNSSAKRLDRSILTIALSRDGRVFDRAFVLKNESTTKRFEGKHKLDGWQYPHAMVVDKSLLVSYSVNKEDVRLARIRLKALSRK